MPTTPCGDSARVSLRLEDAERIGYSSPGPYWVLVGGAWIARALGRPREGRLVTAPPRGLRPERINPCSVEVGGGPPGDREGGTERD